MALKMCYSFIIFWLAPFLKSKGFWQQFTNIRIQRDAIIGSNCKLAICHFYAIYVKRILLKPCKQLSFDILPTKTSWCIENTVIWIHTINAKNKSLRNCNLFEFLCVSQFNGIHSILVIIKIIYLVLCVFLLISKSHDYTQKACRN